MMIYLRLICAKILHPRTKSWIQWIGHDDTLIPRQRVIMYKP